jgi:hypothetical protein
MNAGRTEPRSIGVDTMTDTSGLPSRIWCSAFGSPWLTALLFFAAPVHAQSGHLRETVPMFNLTVGQAGILDGGSPPLRYGVEYRARAFFRWNLIPAIGGVVADDGSRFIYADLRYDYWLADRWVVIPSFGVGTFDNGDEIDLGSSIEFRSGIEIAYRFHGEYRVGIALFHLSNGGISDQNPGTEGLVASLCIPLHRRDRRSGH